MGEWNVVGGLIRCERPEKNNYFIYIYGVDNKMKNNKHNNYIGINNNNNNNIMYKLINKNGELKIRHILIKNFPAKKNFFKKMKTKIFPPSKKIFRPKFLKKIFYPQKFKPPPPLPTMFTYITHRPDYLSPRSFLLPHI